MRHHFNSVTNRKYASGFSLIEIMVGVVIGMLGVIIIAQVAVQTEQRKRTTTGGSDASSEGIMALYALQRDLKQSGYGMVAKDILGCTVTISGASIPLSPVNINPPVAIIPAGDANTDTLLVMYGNAESQPQGLIYASGTVNPTPANYYVVLDGPCTTAPISKGATNRAVDGTYYDLGPSPKILAYAIRSGNLTVCDYTTTNCSAAGNYVSIANNIVSLRAQYGHDITSTAYPQAADGGADAVTGVIPAYKVDTWDQNQTLPAGASTSCKWSRTSAVRLALVARSAQYEKAEGSVDVTTTVPAWEGSSGAPIDLTANADWNHYRYKLFQTVVPLRNVTWMGVLAGC